MGDEPDDFDMDALLQEEEEARYQQEMADMEAEAMMDVFEEEQRQEMQTVLPSTPQGNSSTLALPAAVRVCTPPSSSSSSSFAVVNNKATEVVPPRPFAASKHSSSFAERMQAERIALYGKDLSAHSSSSSSSLTAQGVDVFARTAEFVTRTPAFVRLRGEEVQQYLHLSPAAEDAQHDTCVLGNGRRFFLHDRRPYTSTAAEEEKESERDTHAPSVQQGLLGRSVFELITDAEKISAQTARRKALFLKQREKREQDRLREREEEKHHHQVRESKKREQDRLRESVKSKADNALWVDKYAPQTFTQLLSVEKTNREVLRALKRWDRFVFKKVETTGTNTEEEEELDTDLRPKRKVIMLCGPPGTGKTTLAHICAKHCGYRPVEINASDDRSPDQLRELLARATQSSTLGAEKRPNCVIFDEVDGIDGGNSNNTGKNALDMLLNVINAPLTKGKASSSSSFALTRPLICICNDQHTPALRELRKVSEIFVFAAPQEQRLVQRLKHICLHENVGLSSSTPSSSSSFSSAINQSLSELVAATGLDIRSSINNLQFAALKMEEERAKQRSAGGGERVAHTNTQSDLTSVIDAMMKMGLKDDQLDSFQIWQKIFTRPATATNSGGDNKKDEEAKDSQSLSSGMQTFDAMVDHGEFSQLIDGVHENIFSLVVNNAQQGSIDTAAISRTNYTHMQHFAFSSEWLSRCDTMIYGAMFHGNVFTTAVSYQEGGMQVMNYAALVAPAVHFAHAVAVSPKTRLRLEWPRKDREVFYATASRDNVLQSVRELNPQGAWSIAKKRMVLDIVPFFLELIRPRCRPVPFVSLSADEQSSVLQVAAIMESSGFAYVPTVTHKQQQQYSSNWKKNNSSSAGSTYGGNYKNNQNGAGNSAVRSQKEREKDYTSLLLSDEQVEMLLEPNIELLVEFTDFAAMQREKAEEEQQRKLGNLSSFKKQMKSTVKRIKNHVALSEEVKTLIFTEQRKLAIQWKSEALQETSTSQKNQPQPEPAKKETGPVTVDPPSVSETAPSEVTEKTMDTATLPVSEPEVKTRASGNVHSFFKRMAPADNSSNKKIKLNSNSDVHTAGEKSKKGNVFFRFNQGFSNAVKRPVYIRDFL